jgi:hypothetical protein
MFEKLKDFCLRVKNKVTGVFYVGLYDSKLGHMGGGTIKRVPQKGELIKISENRYRVFDVEYDIGTSLYLIYVERVEVNTDQNGFFYCNLNDEGWKID